MDWLEVSKPPEECAVQPNIPDKRASPQPIWALFHYVIDTQVPAKSEFNPNLLNSVQIPGGFGVLISFDKMHSSIHYNTMISISWS